MEGEEDGEGAEEDFGEGEQMEVEDEQLARMNAAAALLAAAGMVP